MNEKQEAKLLQTVQDAREYALKVHTAARCKYGEDDEDYIVHLDMVEDWVSAHQAVLRKREDQINCRAGAYSHDTIEDAQQSYNDVKDATNKDVADITLSVTDVHAENRMLRFLMTIPKTIKDYRGLFLKVCDIGANSSYGKRFRNSMYKKYKKEWAGYKRNIFITASKWYPNELDLDEFDKLIKAVDEVLEYKQN
jgi:(p)ppGpp synthase/HD superfamily hydrolase